MNFDIITIFPQIFDSYFNESIIKRAQKRNLVKIKIHNLRDYTSDRHKTVDDKPFGGGAGMVMMVGPIFKAVSGFKKEKSSKVRSSIDTKADKEKSKGQKGTKEKTKVILLSAKGKEFNQKKALELSKLDRIVLICGRYEGVDERVAKHIADEEISIGRYVLTGGELPAMVLVDAVARLLPGAIKKKSLKEESFAINKMNNKYLPAGGATSQREYPQYTRPEVFSPKKGIRWQVPEVLLSGNHQKIREWKESHSK